MAANTVAIYPLTPSFSQCQVTVANTNLDGSTGTYVDLLTVATNGTQVRLIKATVPSTSVVDSIYIFISDVNGTNWRLYDSILITAATVSATVKPVSIEYAPSEPLWLKSGQKIKCSTRVGQATNLVAQCGDY